MGRRPPLFFGIVGGSLFLGYAPLSTPTVLSFGFDSEIKCVRTTEAAVRHDPDLGIVPYALTHLAAFLATTTNPAQFIQRIAPFIILRPPAGFLHLHIFIFIPIPLTPLLLLHPISSVGEPSQLIRRESIHHGVAAVSEATEMGAPDLSRRRRQSNLGMSSYIKG